MAAGGEDVLDWCRIAGQGAPEALLCYDGAGVLRWSSPMLEALFGVSGEQVTGTGFVLCGSPYRPTPGALWWRRPDTGAPVWVEVLAGRVGQVAVFSARDATALRARWREEVDGLRSLAARAADAAAAAAFAAQRASDGYSGRR